MYNTSAVEPRIQYAKTEDWVNIAYWTIGGQGDLRAQIRLSPNAGA